MNRKALLKKYIQEALQRTNEMKLGVAGRHSFDVASTDDDPEPTMGPMLGGDYEEDLSCPECGGPPGMCDPMCPDGGMGQDPRDPDRKHDDH